MPRVLQILMLGLWAALCTLGAGSVMAQTAAPRMASHCIALAQDTPGVLDGGALVQNAAFGDPLPPYDVRLHYLSHASFLIETPGGANAITDFTGYVGYRGLIPDVVTMNHAHSSHWTHLPDPAIPHVLQGWGDSFGQGITHSLTVKDLRVRNVSTDIRSGGGVEPRGNSIFVFEVAGLCIAHLGHLHHEPTPAQYAALGRMDVVMAPVDGGMTLELDRMITVLKEIRASVVIPMHWFGPLTLDRFLIGMGGAFAVEQRVGNTLQLSLADLPKQPTIVVLQPRYVEEYE